MTIIEEKFSFKVGPNSNFLKKWPKKILKRAFFGHPKNIFWALTFNRSDWLRTVEKTGLAHQVWPQWSSTFFKKWYEMAKIDVLGKLTHMDKCSCGWVEKSPHMDNCGWGWVDQCPNKDDCNYGYVEHMDNCYLCMYPFWIFPTQIFTKTMHLQSINDTSDVPWHMVSEISLPPIPLPSFISVITKCTFATKKCTYLAHIVQQALLQCSHL